MAKGWRRGCTITLLIIYGCKHIRGSMKPCDNYRIDTGVNNEMKMITIRSKVLPQKKGLGRHPDPPIITFQASSNNAGYHSFSLLSGVLYL